MKSVQLVIPAEAGYIDVVRLCLYGLASKWGFSYEEIEDMKVAVAEACNNAVLHAYEAEGGTVEVSFETQADRFIVLVKDNGRSFNPQPALERASPIQAVERQELQPGGLGLYLMQALMDEVSVESGNGTTVKLVKYKQDEDASPRVHG